MRILYRLIMCVSPSQWAFENTHPRGRKGDTSLVLRKRIQPVELWSTFDSKTGLLEFHFQPPKLMHWPDSARLLLTKEISQAYEQFSVLRSFFGHLLLRKTAKSVAKEETTVTVCLSWALRWSNLSMNASCACARRNSLRFCRWDLGDTFQSSVYEKWTVFEEEEGSGPCSDRKWTWFFWCKKQ